MDWDALEADILHIQCLMKDASFHDANEVAKNCVEALDSTITTLAPSVKMLATNCLMVHRAMSLLRSEEFRESLNLFELVNARRVFTCVSELSGRGFRGVWDLSRDALLHSNLNASVAADNCGLSQLTQSYLEKAIQLYREQLLCKPEAVTWHRLGKLLYRQNKHTQAGLSLNTAALLFKKCQLPVLQAEVLCDLAAVYSAANNTSRLSDVMEQSHFICLSLTEQPGEQRRLYTRLSGLYSDQHAYPDAALCLEHVIASSSGGERARSLVRRGQLLRWMGERARWERSMRDAGEECELLVDFPEEASEVLISIAQECSEVGLYGDTQEHLERAVQMSSACKGAELVMTDALEGLGDVLVKQRREGAAARYREATLLLEKLYDENGAESLGTRLQRVWRKYSSTRQATGEETSRAGDGMILDDSLACEGLEVSNENELDTRSLVTVSDISELSCDETLLATDTPTNRSLTIKTDTTQLEGDLIEIPTTSSPILDDSLVPAVDPPNETIVKQVRPKTRRVRSKVTHSFRSNKITPIVQTSEDTEECGLAVRINGPPSSTEVSTSANSDQDSDQAPTTNKPPTSRTCSLL